MITKLSQVIELFPNGNASDIASQLRQAADNIEIEGDEYDRTRAMIAVQITESGQVKVYGWGKTDTMHALASLVLATAKMSATALEQ